MPFVSIFATLKVEACQDAQSLMKPYISSIHSREQNHTLSLRNGKGKGRGGKKDEKKAKMADCTETPSKRLNRVLYWSGCRNQPPALSQALLILLFHLQSHTRKCSLPPPATTTLHSPKIRAAAHTKRDLLPWLLMMLTE